MTASGFEGAKFAQAPARLLPLKANGGISNAYMDVKFVDGGWYLRSSVQQHKRQCRG